ncbi:MAG: DNA alkylation repair protein [Pyrinomonadaceae bacterium]
MNTPDIMDKLRSHGDRDTVAGMERFGIVTPRSFGVKTPVLKQFAKEVKKEAQDRHSLALELWATGNYDARALAFLIDDSKQVTVEQMESWAADFDNWATVDGTCCYLFCRTPFAYEKALEWAERDDEFVKRAGFSLMAYLAVHDKKADDARMAALLPAIEKWSDDDRNFVKKAVNWSLRQIGKRNLQLNKLAIEAAARIRARGTKAAKWIAADALRELRSDAVQVRLAGKAGK